MSAINVNSITGRTGTHGPVLTGVTTATNGLNITGGSVGIGTDSPSRALEIKSSAPIIRLTEDTNTFSEISGNSSVLSFKADEGNGASTTRIDFRVDGSERMRIDSSGRLLVGTDTARSAGDVTAQLQVEGTSFDTASLNLISNAGAAVGNNSHITLSKTRGSSDGSTTIVASGDKLGAIQWAGADGTDLNSTAASIETWVDGTPGANDMPGRLVLNTTADNASSPTERMRIDSSGRVLINQTSVGAKSVSAPLQLISSSTGAFGLNISMRSNNDYGFISYTDHDADEDIAQIGVQRTAANTGDLIFYTNGGNASATEKARILSTGGITFNGDTATTNALDDYEEGTWSPTIDKSSSSPSVSYSIRLGTYTKIGRLVTVFFDVTATITGGGGGARIYGLPYTVSSSMAGYSRLHFRATSAVAAGNATEQLSGFAQKGDTYLRLQYDDSGVNGYASGGDSNWAASGRVTGYVTYEV